MPDAKSTTIPLEVPLYVEGRAIGSVTIRRPKVGDLRRMENAKGSDLDKSLFLVGALTELSPAEVEELDAQDLNSISTVIEGFTKRG